MIRHVVVAAAVVLAGFSARLVAQAQDGGGAAARHETLAERIQRMRSAAAPRTSQSPQNHGLLQGAFDNLRNVFGGGSPQRAAPRPVPMPLGRVDREPARPRGANVAEIRPRALGKPTPAASSASPSPRRSHPPLTSSRRTSSLPRPTESQDAAPRPARGAPLRVAPPAAVSNDSPPKTAWREATTPKPATNHQPPTTNHQPQTTSSRSPLPEAVRESVLMTVNGPQLQARTLGPSRLVVGREAKFTVMVSNEGDGGAEDVIVSVRLPAWVDVVGATPSRGAAEVDQRDKTQQAVNWHIDRLPRGGSETIALRLIPRDGKPVDLGVRYTYAQSSSRVHVEVEEPKLELSIAGPSETVYGQTKTYTLTVSNPGTGDAENVTIALLPLDGSGDAADSHQLGTLRRGESKKLPVELKAVQSGVVQIRARVAAAGGLKAEAGKEVVVRRPRLEVAAAGPPALYAGNPAVYRVQVKNSGDAAAENIAVSAWLPAGAKFVSAGDRGELDQREHRVRWTIRSLPVGRTVELEAQCELLSDGLNTLRVAATDSTKLTAKATVATTVVARADLKLTVSDPSGPVPIDQEGVYEVEVVNRGTKSAEGVEIALFFSDGIEPVGVEGGEYQLSQGQVLIQPVASLPPGGKAVFQVRAKASAVGDHTFRAEVVCRSLGTRLATQETTHYYGKDFARTAAQPKPTPAEAAPINLLQR